MNCQCHQKLIVSLQSDLRKEVRKERRNITLEWKVYGNRIFFSVSSRPRKCLAHIYSVNICTRKEGKKKEKEREERNTNVSKFLYADHLSALVLLLVDLDSYF